MRYLLFGLLITFSQGFGQNLISNPYFNEVKDCSIPSYLDFFTNWFNPTSSKVNRAFHPCLDNIPYSPFGVDHFKYPKGGEGMQSILIYYDIENDRRSYTANRLKSALVQHTPYYVRFYVSPKRKHNDSRNIVVDAVGLYLSANYTTQDIITVLPYQPQIERVGQFFDDYDRWYRVQGKYIANGGENVAVIGSFRNNKNTQFKYNNPSSGSVGNMAEIFIDDVLIEAFDPLPDTILLCDRQSINLNAGFHDARYQWNTGQRDSMVTVNRSGKYKIRATIDTLEFEDSTQVIFMDEFSNNTTIDIFFCEGSELVLNSPIPGMARWSAGDVTSSISIHDEGTYSLSVENTCGTYQFTYNVTKRDCNCDLVLPSAFSPNGDRQNDVFTIIDQCRYRIWRLGSFKVYDKWGGMVYQESGSTVSWNGQSSGREELPAGVYAYRLEAIVQEGKGEESVIKTGSVHLLR